MVPRSAGLPIAYGNSGTAVPTGAQRALARRASRARAIARHPFSLAFVLLLANLGVFAAAWTLQDDPVTDGPANAQVARVLAVDPALHCAECTDTAR